MEYEQIKKLIDDMGNSKLTSINIDFPDGTKISMTKEESKTIVVKDEKVETKSFEKNIEEEVQKEQNTNSKIVKSPMVGVFYSKPSPTAQKYVDVRKRCKGRRYSLHY